MIAAAPPSDTRDAILSRLVETAGTLQETALRLEDIALCPRAIPLEPEVQRGLLLNTTRSLSEPDMIL